MSSDQRANTGDVDGLEAAVDQAIAACGGDLRSAIRALIVANDYLETEVGQLAEWLRTDIWHPMPLDVAIGGIRKFGSDGLA